MNRRVCHMSSAHKPDDIRIFKKQCRSLAAHGFDVHFIVRQSGNDEKEGVKRWGIPTRPGRFRRMTQSVYDVFKKAKDLNADLYHFHDPELLPVGLALKLHGARVVFDSHEDLPRQILSKPWIPQPLRPPVSWSCEIGENLGLRALDAVIGATPHITQRFIDLGMHAVTVNNYPMLGELDLIEANWDTKKRQVCYVGGISAIRGAHEMVQAAGISKIRLQLAGPFSNEKLKTDILSLNGASNTNYLGTLSRPNVAQLLHESIAGVVVFSEQPNHINAQPNKLFEYLAGGIPVIASNFPLWKKLITEEKIGICVNPANPSEIAEAMRYLADNLELAEEMGRRGQALVRKQCNWQQEERTLIELYNKIL